jgi:hypothetical protein
MNDAPAPRLGGCLCGAVRYRIAAEPLLVEICHCASCRRAVGAPSVAWAVVPAAAFALIAGTPARHASSPGVERTHCAACGTSLTYRSEAETIDVTLASLDDPTALAPTLEIWLADRLPWQPVDPARSLSDRGSG